MSPSLRFLAIAVIGWTGFRIMTASEFTGGSLIRLGPGATDAQTAATPAPPIVPTQFPDLPPVETPGAAAVPNSVPPWAVAYPYAYPPAAMAPYYSYPPIGPRFTRAARPPMRYASYTPIQPLAAPVFDSPIPAIDDWPLSRLAAIASSPLRSSVAAPGRSQAPGLSARFDRLRVSVWALVRGQSSTAPSTPTLGSAGTLGGSQAGARLTYFFARQLAASLRTSSAIGRRGGEVAVGARVQPLVSIPVWVTAERRQRIGRYGDGRNAFALFLEGGVYDRAMPLGLKLDAYAQGGVVGLRSRDRFIEGAATLTRPVYRNFSAGVGVWGGAQPGLYRLDAGPRITMRLRNNLRIYLDYRQRLAGNSLPGSGPAVTLAGDF